MNWLQWAVSLLFAALAGAWLKSYFGEKGKQQATYESLPSLLKQEFAKAFEQEAGKRLASHEDMENVLRELKTVTHTTETIKADISTSVWLRQTLWMQKREVYAKLLGRVHDLHDTLNSYRSTSLMAQQDEAKGLPLAHVVNLQSQAADRFTELTRAQKDFLDAMTEAEIFVDEIAELRKRYLNYSGLAAFWADHQDSEKSFQLMQFVSFLQVEVVKHARKDLGTQNGQDVQLTS